MTDAKTRKVELSEARKDLDALIDEASKGRKRIVLEQDGATVAVVISAREYEKLLRMDAEIERDLAILDRSRAAFADVPQEELQQEIDKALAVVHRKTATRRKVKTPA